jgi:glycosyltransferase involved in cell wall biosynthesis
MSLKYLIVSYTHLLDGKPTTLGGPAIALKKYLGDKADCIWQPIPIGKPAYYYFLLKLRDIWLVLTNRRVADVYIGVEALNALLGRILGYSKVIYWNLDYSPSRCRLWHWLDKLAIKYSDEVWTLSERGYKTVPIGYWKDNWVEQYKRDPNGIVYIGLLQDMQGVEQLVFGGTILPQWNITIIGTGKDEDKYKLMAKDYKNIKFTGLISDDEARKIMKKNTWGWAYYHPLNPTHKTTPPTKPITYYSCGLKVLGDEPKDPKTWEEIFKNLVS